MNTDGDSELRRSSARKSWDSLSLRYVRVRSAKKKFSLFFSDFNEICFLCCLIIVVVFAFFFCFCFALFCFCFFIVSLLLPYLRTLI